MVDRTMMTKEASQSTHNRESIHTIVKTTVFINFWLFPININLVAGWTGTIGSPH